MKTYSKIHSDCSLDLALEASASYSEFNDSLIIMPYNLLANCEKLKKQEVESIMTERELLELIIKYC